MNLFAKSVCCAAILLFQWCAGAESLSEFYQSIADEEKAMRKPEKPVDEMTDAEVADHAVNQIQDKVSAIGIGMFKAIDDACAAAGKHAADFIRKRESGNTHATNIVTAATKSENPKVATSPVQTNLHNECGMTERADLTTEEKKDDIGDAVVTFVVVALIIAVVIYGIAYVRVRAGDMIVYASWGDFILSAAWVVLLLVGFGCDYAAANGNEGLTSVAKILKYSGFASALWMVGGAFLNRGILNILLAIPARIIVAVLVLLAWTKLKEALDGLKDNRRGLVDGVLIPLTLALFIFNALVKPMVGDRR